MWVGIDSVSKDESMVTKAVYSYEQQLPSNKHKADVVREAENVGSRILAERQKPLNTLQMHPFSRLKQGW